ncbi:MAG TPA: F0F1 ATP synthase subunit B [Candidatus Paceibacterota bacterium]|nr:F0F1 ATP synthase subunit B [Candidatus Paceibacterota bacterium]
MAELFGQLGVDIKLLAAQGVNFLLVLVVLMSFVYRPLLKLMKERQARIEKGLADAKAAEALLEEIEAERLGILAATDQENRRRIEEAEEKAALRGNELVASATGRAYEEAKRIMAEAQVEIERERRGAERAVKKEAAGLIVRGMEKLLRTEMTPAKNDELIKKLTL